MGGHVDRLLSAACDGALSADARARFDRHLAGCPACAAAFARMTTAVDALRELGAARMPRPVLLPEGAPIAGWGFSGWPPRPQWGRRWAAGLSAAGVVAAGAVAAVVVTREPAAGYPSAAGSQAAPAVPTSGAVPSASAHQPGSAVTTTCSPQPLGSGAASATQVPPGFNNRDSQDDGIATVVVATPASGFSPGETVDIYARLVDDATGAVYLPCTSLAGPLTLAPGSSPLTAPGLGIAATPVGRLTVDGQPVVEVIVPRSARAGETFQVVVEVPAGAGEAQAHQVTLSIQVT